MIFRFCPHCGQSLETFTHEERERARCPECGWIHYRNPAPGVAVVLVENGELLLGLRRTGGWCIPCGYIEWGESVEDAARREFLEETGLEVQLGNVLAVRSNFHNPDLLTVGIWFTGTRISGVLRPGGDLVEVAFRPLDNIGDLKFPTDQEIVDLLRCS